MQLKLAAAQAAMERLIAANQAYVAGAPAGDLSAARREDLANNGQFPFAVIVSCSDSRVPPEHLFNMGLGDLFVIRTAGNVIGTFELGSVEYGAEHLGAPLIVVLGHSGCGAVAAACGGHAEGNIAAIVQEIMPCVEKARVQVAQDQVVATAENLNIQAGIDKILSSDIVAHLIKENKVAVVGAKYDIHTGLVRFGI